MGVSILNTFYDQFHFTVVWNTKETGDIYILMRATASYLDERLVVPAIFQPFAADRVGVSAIDDGYPLIWMCFSTLVFLLCCLYSKTTNFSKQNWFVYSCQSKWIQKKRGEEPLSIAQILLRYIGVILW